MSLDGYIDDLRPERLILSNEKDKIAVDKLKSTFDAILVGAQTVRKDNPSLLIKSYENRESRKNLGLCEHPIKVTITMNGDLKRESRFFQEGDHEKLVYCPLKKKAFVENKIGDVATVIGLETKDILNPIDIVQDLHQRGITRLMIEGGASINRLFLTHHLVDEIRLAIAPIILFQGSTRFVGDGDFGKMNENLVLKSIENLDGIAVLNYTLIN